MRRSEFLELMLAGALGTLAGCQSGRSERNALLNVSYDPTRELWRDVNRAFADSHLSEHGERVTVHQSHGGSSTQARAVIDGLYADIVTLASFLDTDAIAKRGLIAENWLNRLPNRSLPFTSTIVFVVRAGNPKQIRDWPDLVRPGVAPITPNPKTSGNGYLAFFAAWGSILLRGGSRAEAVDYVRTLYRAVPVLDSGARGSAVTFVRREIGDVHLAWENEAALEVRESRGKLEIVHPPISILAEPHVTLVDQNVDAKGTRAIAERFLHFLYRDEAQRIIARHHMRPISSALLREEAARFPAIERFPITAIAQSFSAAHRELIAEGGVFDSIYGPRG